jgi:hypothetical protein
VYGYPCATLRSPELQGCTRTIVAGVAVRLICVAPGPTQDRFAGRQDGLL